MNRRIYECEVGVSGDTIQVVVHEDGQVHIELDSPWTGDTETGFGASIGVTLPASEAKKLALIILGPSK